MSTAPYVLGGLAAVFAVKTLFRPHRAVVREGSVAACPGDNSYRVCDPTLRVTAPEGTNVFSTGPGRVMAVGPDFVHIALRAEPTILYYDGIAPDVREGQYVGRGQVIGVSRGRVSFGVQQFASSGVVSNVDPSSWLAARGHRIAARYTGSGSEWCAAAQGRHVTVPRSAGAACNLQEPDSADFALLPVSVEIER